MHNLQPSSHPFLTSNLPRVPENNDSDKQDAAPNPNRTTVFMKGPKRKRLAKVISSLSSPFCPNLSVMPGLRCLSQEQTSLRRHRYVLSNPFILQYVLTNSPISAPCSNCYYASKACTYTDASGRPVPAPRPFNPERNDVQVSSDASPQPYTTQYADAARFNHSISPPNNYAPNPSSSSQAMVTDLSEDDNRDIRKRFRNERGNPIPTDDIPLDGPISGPSMDRPTPVKLDHLLTRELTNLFFTHCHPARTIIHKPSFSTALSHNQVPLYLIHAICALAAPLSKQPRIRTSPPRFAGKPFAQEALSIMFDGAGRLVCELNLATAQALCLLQIHDIITKDKNMSWNTRYHDLALQIAKSLGVHSPDNPLLTPLPSPEFIQTSLEREAVRRTFWLIHMLDVMASIYFKKPLAIAEGELRLRLPADETSFELAVHSTLPEYLYLPPIKTQYASEFGHLIRILMIYAKVEYALDYLSGLKESDSSINPAATVFDTEQRLQEWNTLLPEHLRFSEQNLSVQQSMFETSSNNGAWCYCCMHVYHASCLIALNNARQILQRTTTIKVGPQRALDMLEQIIGMLGERAKNSLLMCAALWTYIQHCGRDDLQIHALASEYEAWWGTRMFDLVRDWRSRMTPSQQQLHQLITPPQQYIQHNQLMSLKRRHPATSSNPDVSPTSRSPSNHSPTAVHSRPTLRSAVNSISPSLMPGHLSSDSCCPDPDPHLSISQPIPMPSVATQRVQLSSGEISLPEMSQTPGVDPTQVGHKHHHSPTLSPSSSYPMGRYLEDPRYANPNNSHRHQANGKDKVRGVSGSGAAALFIANSGAPGQGGSLGGTASEGPNHNLDWEHQKLVWDRDRDQHQPLGYNERARKESAFHVGNGSFEVSLDEGTHRDGKSSQRTHPIASTIAGDGSQQLPSLKASGLLDSWTSSRLSDKPSRQAQMRGGNGTQQGSPRRSPSASYHKQMPGHAEPGGDSSRSVTSVTTSSMPVGLQWLANESR
ncbi:hypothetical protein AX17_003603 [Amanita inopinata Kibby_2008]|nr:hypothetical protein AX17_003603 [Amanita inopinata Kibby_2008]